MKRCIYEGILCLFCVFSGCVSGYGIHSLTNAQNEIEEQETKDNTLLREEYDSVFFVEENADTVPKESEKSEKTEKEETEPSPIPSPIVSILPSSTVSILPSPTAEPQASVAEEPTPAKIPTLMVVLPSVTPENAMEQEREMAQREQNSKEDTTSSKSEPTPETKTVITYPSEIFGQTPVVNREDTYVTYFEFALDLITTLEPEIKRSGKNEMALFTEFMIKALFCGIDVQKVKLNDPIPRDVAALAVHLAAQVLDKPGIETSVALAQKYASDVSGCSSAEKKAIAYLYEQGVVRSSAEKRFYPDASLSEKNGAAWIAGASQVWE